MEFLCAFRSSSICRSNNPECLAKSAVENAPTRDQNDESPKEDCSNPEEDCARPGLYSFRFLHNSRFRRWGETKPHCKITCQPEIRKVPGPSSARTLMFGLGQTAVGNPLTYVFFWRHAALS